MVNCWTQKKWIDIMTKWEEFNKELEMYDIGFQDDQELVWEFVRWAESELGMPVGVMTVVELGMPVCLADTLLKPYPPHARG